MDDLISIFVIVVLLILCLISILKAESMTGIFVALLFIIVVSYIVIYVY